MASAIIKGRAPSVQNVTISSGSTASSVFDLRNAEYVGFLITSTALSSTAFTFAVATSSDATFYPLWLGDSTTTQVVIGVTTNAAKAYVVNVTPNIVAPWSWGKLICSSTEGAARTIKVCVS